MAMSISPETQRILTRLVTSGQFKSQDEAIAEAVRLLQDNQSAADQNGLVLPPANLRERLKQHIETTPDTAATQIDDSRESIYEGRGE